MSTIMSAILRRLSHSLDSLGTGTRSANQRPQDRLAESPACATGKRRTTRPAPRVEDEITLYLDSQHDLPTPSLNALDSRSPSYLDIISYLIDTGRTPAESLDIQAAFVALHDRLPGPGELNNLVFRVREFGLLA